MPKPSIAAVPPDGDNSPRFRRFFLRGLVVPWSATTWRVRDVRDPTPMAKSPNLRKFHDASPIPLRIDSERVLRLVTSNLTIHHCWLSYWDHLSIATFDYKKE